MSQHYKVIGVASEGDALTEVRQNEGIDTYAVQMTRSITPVQDIIATYQLYKLFKKEKPFIVHTHTPKAGTLGMLAAKIAGVPHRLHTIAGLPLLETKGIKRLLLDSVEKLTYACSTHILPNSFGLKSIILQNKYTKASKLKVIGNGSSNGIDTAHYDVTLISEKVKEDLKEALNINSDDVVFIFIGRIVRDKGINELVQAFNELCKTNNKTKLILVGPRETLLDPLEPITESLILENNQINYVGVQKDIRPYCAIAQVLAFPSYREGFPNVVLQASCLNLPCIVSNINGCNEIIENNVNGLIIKTKDVNSLLQAMQYMIDNKDKREEMSKNSRAKIIQRYQQDYVWNELFKFYKSLE